MLYPQLLFDQNQLMDLWSIFDSNHTGQLEWPGLALRLAAMCCKGRPPLDTLELAFYLFDVNGDNRLERQEFRAMLEPLLPDASHYHNYWQRVEQLFSAADTSHDQVIGECSVVLASHRCAV